MSLQNFIVNEKIFTVMPYCPNMDAQNIKRDLNHGHDLVYLESTPHDKEQYPKIYSKKESDNTDLFDNFVSLYHYFLVDRFSQNNMHTPQYNINRNRNKRNHI